ncbi:MAG: flagellar hook-associated protein FlgL [Dehalococcoidia bacterium]|nr:flagellar hook-associated protein FlgL [Dehalococcoidia bacterium]
MRLSEQSRLTANQRYLSTIQEGMAKLQEQLATGRKIQRASDDPAGASLALQHRKNIAYETQMRRNLEGGISFMNVSEAALSGVNDSLQRVRELTVQASSDSLGPNERHAIALEVDELIEHMAQAANTRFGDAFVFSGHQTQTPAYAVTGDPPTAVTFQGDTGQRVRRISFQEESPINVVGVNVFGTMFDDLIQLSTDLKAGATGVTITGHLGAIDAAIEQVIGGRAELGARTNRFEAALAQSESTNITLQELKRDIEEVDLAEAITKMTSQQTALEAAIGAIGTTSRMSLLNFLQ